jgi:hypothetical protein
MLVEYLFVYSEKNHSFPVRLRVIAVGEGPDISDADQLTGSVEKSDVNALMDRLRQKYPSPGFRVAKSWANTWQAVARNYAGLDYDHFSSSPPKKADPAPPKTPASPLAQPPQPSTPQQGTPKPTTAQAHSTDTQPVAARMMETAASKGTHVYNFAGVVLFLGGVAVAWPEFAQRYGGLVSWFWTFVYNPGWGIYGIMYPLCIAAGAYALYWFIYYRRIRVIVDSGGIRFHPTGRFVSWNDVEHIRYAQRRMRYTGTPRQALRLEVLGQKPVNLPHKFDEMERLVSIVREYVEPVVLQKCKDRISDSGSVSFGKQITITPERLELNELGVPVPLDQVGHVVNIGGILQITNEDGHVIFSRAVESIPDAPVISKCTCTPTGLNSSVAPAVRS